jgi:hypothetical protein
MYIICSHDHCDDALRLAQRPTLCQHLINLSAYGGIA